MPARMSGQQPQPGGDPVQGALTYGRRKAGLPVDFEQGHTAPSFDGGGVVPDPSAAPPQPQATDPQQLLKYLSGDGALSPDVIMAMEAMADPDSSMDATDRMSAVLGKAPSPDVAFGVLQHHRTKYNGHTAAARVAADKGDYAKAAMHANKAHESVPGSRKRFAPVPGGVQMMNGSAPQTSPQEPQEEAYAQGGAVDSSNPNDDNGYTDDTGSENAYADGGEIDTRYDDFPDSDNVEDRRHEHGEGWAGKGDGPDPDSGSINGSSIPDLNRWNEGKAKEGERKEFERNSGVVRKQQSFAYGGEVDEEDPDVTAAVTPDDSGGGTNDDDLTTGSTPEPASPSAGVFDPLGGGGSTPYSWQDKREAANTARMLSPEDLSRTMSLGWDAAVASVKKNFQGVADAWNAPTPLRGRGDTEQGEDSGEFPWQGPMPADGGPTEPTGRGDTQGPGEGTDPDAAYKKDRQHANERRDEMMKWYEDQSRKLFPWASQEGQRQAFIMQGMERFFGHDLSRENNIRTDKAGVAARGLEEKKLEHAETEAGKNRRAAANQETKKEIAAFNGSVRGQQFAQSEIAKTIRAAMATDPDAMDPKKVETLRQQLQSATGIKVPTGDIDTMKEILGLGKSIVRPQGQGGGEIRVGAQRINPKDGSLVTRQEDGSWK